MIGGGATAPARVITFDELDSSNAEARRRAEAGEFGPLWIVARRQSAGRGRRGRAWETGAGDLAATLLTTTDLPPARAAEITFVAALAVSDMVMAWVEAEQVKVKWPNDVLIAGCKVSGILVESGRLDGRLWLAVGVGLNLAGAPADVERPATSLSRHLAPARGEPPGVDQAVLELAAAFDRRLAIWRSYGFEPVMHAWVDRAYGLGGPCTVRLEYETIEGVAEGVETDGALRLRQAGGEVRRITAGDVLFGGIHAAGR